MKSNFNLKCKKYLWPLLVAHRLVWRPTSYLHQTGWVESHKRGYPCDKSGEEVPWMNYSVISFLKERLNKNLSLFEYGCGYSTLFYSRLVRDVVSVEYDQIWLDHIKSTMPDNVELVYRDKDSDGDYCRTISSVGNSFDVVIVDGRDRVNCVREAFTQLKKGGVVVLDDSGRDRYQEAFNIAKHNGFRALNIEGIKPTGNQIHRTTIFYTDNSCLAF